MAAMAYNNVGTTGHGSVPPTKCIASASTVFINGIPALLNGDDIIPHAAPGSTPHGGKVMASTSKVFIEGKPAAMIGDPISCGDTIAAGSSNVFGS